MTVPNAGAGDHPTTGTVSPSSAGSVPKVGPAGAGLRVLVIDDQAIVLQAMKNLLDIDGHHVTVADSGRVGVELLEKSLAVGMPFEVVLTDFGMPGMDGGEVARRVKQLHPATWVVLLSGGGPLVDARDDWKASVDHVLGKPPRLAQLRGAMPGARDAPASG